MIMVRVRLKDDKEVIGLLVDTHLVPTQGSSQVSMTPDKRLVQGPPQQGLRGFGVAAVEGGFIVGPLESMKPIFNPQEELGDDAPPGTDTGTAEGEREAEEGVPAELGSRDGREEEGERP